MRAGDLVKHRDIGVVGILIKLKPGCMYSKYLPWFVSIQKQGGRIVTWFSASIEIINESR